MFRATFIALLFDCDNWRIACRSRSSFPPKFVPKKITELRGEQTRHTLSLDAALKVLNLVNYWTHLLTHIM